MPPLVPDPAACLQMYQDSCTGLNHCFRDEGLSAWCIWAYGTSEVTSGRSTEYTGLRVRRAQVSMRKHKATFTLLYKLEMHVCFGVGFSVCTRSCDLQVVQGDELPLGRGVLV